MKKFKFRKRTIIFLILTVAIFSSAYLLAKYTSSFDGSDNAKVAKWNVSYNTNNLSGDVLNLISGDGPTSYTISVTSTSEVSAKYSIILSNVPSELEVKLDNGTYITPTNNRIEFSNAGSFMGADINRTFTHTLTFNAPLEADIVNTSTIGIDIDFDQIN